jgi:signal peptidase I
MNAGSGLWRTLRFYGAFAVAYFAFTSIAFAQYYIPSGSMRPTLEIGDRVLVNKFAFGWSRYSLPMLLAERIPVEGRIMAHAPQRGEVIVFRRPDQPLVLIKRVVALPGETAEVRGGQVFIDGEPAALAPDGLAALSDTGGALARLREGLPAAAHKGRTHYIYDQGAGLADDFGPYIVPADCYFVMGDNRDNSADSRFWGCVPMANIIGRAETIGWTLSWLKPDPAAARDPDRFWRPL